MRLRAVVESDLPVIEWQLADLDTENVTHQWQPSRVFQDVRSGGGYIFFARTSDDIIHRYEVPYEDQLQILSLGGRVIGTVVRATFTTNIPAVSKMDWGIGNSFPFDPELFLDQTEFQLTSRIYHSLIFPISFVGSLHLHRPYVRSFFNQLIQGPVTGIFYVPGEVELFSFSMEPEIVAEIINSSTTLIESSELSGAVNRIFYKYHTDLFSQEFQTEIIAYSSITKKVSSFNTNLTIT